MDFLLFGKRGSGKTFIINTLLTDISKKYNHVTYIIENNEIFETKISENDLSSFRNFSKFLNEMIKIEKYILTNYGEFTIIIPEIMTEHLKKPDISNYILFNHKLGCIFNKIFNSDVNFCDEEFIENYEDFEKYIMELDFDDKVPTWLYNFAHSDVEKHKKVVDTIMSMTYKFIMESFIKIEK